LLVLGFPKNGVVQAVLGGRKLLVLWMALGVAVWLNMERCDRLLIGLTKKLFSDKR